MTANTFYFYNSTQLNFNSVLSSGDLTAMQGGLILVIILLIVSACVFAIKFALDIVLSRKISSLNDTIESTPLPQEREKFFYAVKNTADKPATPRKRVTRTSESGYTLIPEDKLFVVKSGPYRD